MDRAPGHLAAGGRGPRGVAGALCARRGRGPVGLLRLRRHLLRPALVGCGRPSERGQPGSEPVPLCAGEEVAGALLDHHGRGPALPGVAFDHGSRQVSKGRTRTTPVEIAGTAMVTGGTSGIGLAFARALAERGCDLILVARNRQRLDQTAEELRQGYDIAVHTVVADLTDHADVDTVARRLEEETAPVDILVNNAGNGIHTPLTATDMSVHEVALDVMVRAVLLLGGAAGRAMQKRGSGIIINVGSVAGLVAMGSYSAIKSWVNTYSESLSLELEGAGVQVVTLIPGWVRTEFHERASIRTSSIPRFLWLDARRLVEDCLKDVEAGRPRSAPSKRFKVLAWGAQRMPRAVVRRATALIRKGRA